MPLNEEQKLVWLGLNNVAGQENAWRGSLDSLKNLYDFDEIKDKFRNDWDSFSDYKSDVDAQNRTGDAGVEDYQTWENKLVSVFGTPDDVKNPTSQEKSDAWTEHENSFLNEYDNYKDFENEFSTSMAITGTRRTSEGDTAAGIRIHDSSGRTKDGFTVPEGTVEIFGGEIHFAETGETRSGSGSGGTTTPNITYRNLSVTNNTPNVGETVEVSAEVKNEGTSFADVVVPLKEDENVTEQTTIGLGPNQVSELTFEITKTEQTRIEVTVGNISNSETITWISPRIQ